jgi:hypothetical protein
MGNQNQPRRRDFNSGAGFMKCGVKIILVSIGLYACVFWVGHARAVDECCYPLATADSPVRYFDGNSFAFRAPCPSVSCYPCYTSYYGPPRASTSYYTPGYYSRAYEAKNIMPPESLARNAKPWPYFYTPAGDYTPGYYSYYYTPGFFRGQ